MRNLCVCRTSICPKVDWKRTEGSGRAVNDRPRMVTVFLCGIWGSTCATVCIGGRIGSSEET